MESGSRPLDLFAVRILHSMNDRSLSSRKTTYARNGFTLLELLAIIAIIAIIALL